MFARCVLVAMALFAISAEAFVGSPVRVNSRTPALFSRLSMSKDQHPEIEVAEKAALEATKKFGVSSKEAQLAWDFYEEVAAQDNSVATLPPLDDSCDTEKLGICEEYQDQMKELDEILAKGPASNVVSLEQLALQNKKLIEENSRLRASLGTYK